MTTATIPFTGDLLEHAQDHAIQCPEGTFLHAVEGEEVTTRPFSLAGLELEDLDALTSFASVLIDASTVSWLALQVEVWADPSGALIGLRADAKPDVLVSANVAIVVIDAEGVDFWAAEIGSDGNLSRWRMAERRDANSVCS